MSAFETGHLLENRLALRFKLNLGEASCEHHALKWSSHTNAGKRWGIGGPVNWMGSLLGSRRGSLV